MTTVSPLEFKYNCDLCNIKTNSLKDYNNHIKTDKHYNKINGIVRMPKEPIIKAHICECGNVYKYRQGLYKHKISCNFVKSQIEQISNEQSTQKPPENVINTLEKEILSEFKNIIIKQNETTQELIASNEATKQQLINLQQQQLLRDQHRDQQYQQQTEDFQNKLLELAAKPTTNNTTNNNSFSLNLFLNETCKNAIDIDDFLTNLNITYADIECVKNNGYVDGITNIILKELAALAVNKRPIHCTDLKREILYIRGMTKWNKDNDTNEMMRTIIKSVANRNYNKIIEWSDQTPNSMNPEHDLYEFRIDALANSICNSYDAHKLENKIIKTIAKNVKV